MEKPPDKMEGTTMGKILCHYGGSHTMQKTLDTNSNFIMFGFSDPHYISAGRARQTDTQG